MNTGIGSSTHLGDAAIMRLLDGDDSVENARSAAHVRSCGHCAEQLAALRADAVTVRAWLDRAAFEEAVFHGPRPAAASEPEPVSGPGRPLRGRRAAHGTPWLRAAAVLLLLAAPVAAVPALRSFVAERFADVRGGAETPANAVTAAADAATVRFVPDLGEFMVRFDEPQAAGTLTVRYSAADEAVLRITGDAGAGPIISAQSVHVRNLPESAGSYVLEVPTDITVLHIQVGDRAPVVLAAGDLRAGVRLPVH